MSDDTSDLLTANCERSASVRLLPERSVLPEVRAPEYQPARAEVERLRHRALSLASRQARGSRGARPVPVSAVGACFVRHS